MNDYYDPYAFGGALAFFAVFGFLFLLFFAAFYIVAAVFLMRLFDKAGVQGKWRAWVPVYNTMVLGKLGDVSPWVVLGAIVASAILGQIPFLGFFIGLLPLAAAVMFGWRVGLKLDKDWYWLLLWLIPGVGTLVWLGILAFDGSRWNRAIAPAPWRNSFLADTTVWQGIPVQTPAEGYAPPAGYAAPGAYPPPAPGAYPPPAGYAPPASPGAAPTPPAQPGAAPEPPTSEPPAPPTEPRA